MAPAQIEKRAMSHWERIKLQLYRLMPDRLMPEDLRGKMVINSFLNSEGRGSRHLSRYEREILRTPGTMASINAYLEGAGKSKIPELVGKGLGDKWYTGIAKQLSKLPIVNGYAKGKIMDRVNPGIAGSESLAQQFIDAGGQV